VVRLAIIAIIAVLMSGCMYQQSATPNNTAVIKDALYLVQKAVDDYKLATGVLPIKTFNATTPLYEQCIIDFSKLQAQGVIGEVPKSAFESGGSNYFVIINPDTKPEVKLLDIVSLQAVNDIQSAVTTYMVNHKGEVPTKKLQESGWCTIDYKKMKLDAPSILSPYSHIPMLALVAKTGRVILDYRTDIAKAMELVKVTNPANTIDLRAYLTQAGFYVPGRSTSYFWRNNAPTLSMP
jgi:hypothetical protein